MIELNYSQGKLLEKIFSYTEETPVLSFIQGHMGRGFVNGLPRVSCAQILIGDLCFFAGDFDDPAATELVKNIPAAHPSPCLLMVPQNDGWGALIESAYGGFANKFSRYAI